MCLLTLFYFTSKQTQVSPLCGAHSTVSVRAVSDVNYPASSSVVSLFSGGEHDTSMQCFRYLGRRRLFACCQKLFQR
jgi:hypothetical protein